MECACDGNIYNMLKDTNPFILTCEIYLTAIFIDVWFPLLRLPKEGRNHNNKQMYRLGLPLAMSVEGELLSKWETLLVPAWLMAFAATSLSRILKHVNISIMIFVVRTNILWHVILSVINTCSIYDLFGFVDEKAICKFTWFVHSYSLALPHWYRGDRTKYHSKVKIELFGITKLINVFIELWEVFDGESLLANLWLISDMQQIVIL